MAAWPARCPRPPPGALLRQWALGGKPLAVSAVAAVQPSAFQGTANSTAHHISPPPFRPFRCLSCSAAKAVKDAFVAEDLQGPGKGLPSARAKFEAGRRCACWWWLLSRGSQGNAFHAGSQSRLPGCSWPAVMPACSLLHAPAPGGPAAPPALFSHARAARR